MSPAHVITMARIAVLGQSATIGVLGGLDAHAMVNPLLDAGLVEARRPDPDPCGGTWGVLALTGQGRVVLAAETARWGGRRLPCSARQVPLFE